MQIRRDRRGFAGTLWVAAFAAGFVVAGCHGSSSDAGDSARARSSRDSMAPTLEWEEAREGDRATVSRLPAEVVTPPHRSVSEGPPVDAVILEWKVTEGERVEVGDPLAEVRSPVLADLNADIARFRKIVEKRRRVVEWRRENAESGFGTRTEVMEAEVAVAEAEADLQSARRRAAARRGRALERSGSTERWVSTAAGRVARIACSVGRLQPAGTTCVDLTTEGSTEIRVEIPQKLSSRLDSRVRAVWRPLGAPRGGAGIPLVRTRRAGRLSAESHTRSYYFRLRDSSGKTPELTVGVSGTVTLDVPAPDGAVLVPRLAVTEMGDASTIFVRRDGEPAPLSVEVLGEYHTDYLVRGEGLEAGMPVVARGAFNLKSQRVLK